MIFLRRLFPFVKPYWKASLFSLFLLTAVVVMDLAIPRLTQRIVDQGIAAGDPNVILQTTWIMLGISVLSTVFAIANNIFSVQVGESVARDLREALFLKIQSFSFANLDRMRTGQLMVRLSSDTGAFQRLVQVSLRIGTRAPMLMVGSILLMFNTDRTLSLTIVPLLVVTSAIMAVFITRMGGLYRTIQQKLDWLNTVLQENIAGVRVVKAFVRAGHESERFAEANEAYTNRNIQVMRFMATLSPALSLCMNIGIVVIIWAGGIQAIEGRLSLGQIVAFTNYLLTTMGPLMIMVMLSNVWAAGMASAERVVEVLDTMPDVQDPKGALALPEKLERPHLVFEDVSFHYNSSQDGAVLQGINLVAEPGQTVAILGATGSGKTTLVNLIPRFYDVTGGRITLNGIDIRKLRQDTLLAHVGVVPQETILFSGSVAENIGYGCPEADFSMIQAAARAAQAHEFILKLPQGYDTHVEERGVNLSGGQKQRIAIARALLTRPAILILDDSTSSVDVETETRIQEAMQEWLSGSTSFIVAQRISTVLRADKIIVIDDGRIAAEGTHTQLLQSSPIYQEIYASQLGNGFRLIENGVQEQLEAGIYG